MDEYLQSKRNLDVPHQLIAENQYSEDYSKFIEDLSYLVPERNIRTWHFTRLTDQEVSLFLTKGVELSTKNSLNDRLARVVADGLLNENFATKILEDSPLHRGQADIREHQFCMISCPRSVRDCRVELLLQYWGGEVVYFWQQDAEILEALSRIGRSRVVELKLSLSCRYDCHSVAEAMAASFARSLGEVASQGCFDIFFKKPLPSSSIIQVHSEGEDGFNLLEQCGGNN